MLALSGGLGEMLTFCGAAGGRDKPNREFQGGTGKDAVLPVAFFVDGM
jgi:hypothetical protein